jgi:adenylate cyclase
MSRRRVDALTESREALERLQSPLLARRLAEDPDFLARPVTQPGVILFFDVSGFTGFSEAIGPELTRNFQNELMEIVAGTVTNLGGGLITFLGDGAMVVFGLPAPRPDDAVRALAALDGLDRAFTPWLAQWSADAPQPLTMIYGLQAGPIVASRVGSHAQQTVTVAGDTVNVASRLMEVAKRRGATAAVGESVFAAAAAADRDTSRRSKSADIDRTAGGYSAPENVDIRGRKAPERIRVRL